MEKQIALIVLGMHRSGTSLLTGLLSQVGVDMGHRLYAPQKGVNEKGFWEHADIVDAHDELLLAFDSQWDDLWALPEHWSSSDKVQPFYSILTSFLQRDFAKAAIWGLKDPRMCRLLPLWLSIFDSRQITPVFVCMNRNPFEVVASLQKRDGFSKQKALLLWLSYTLAAEYDTRDRVRTFVDFDRLVTDPLSVVSDIETNLAIHYPISVDVAKSGLTEFVSPQLRHHAVAQRNNSDGCILTELAEKLYELLGRLAADQFVNYADIDAISDQLSEYREQWSIELVEQIRYLNRERADYRRKFFQIYRSWSWLAVKPFWLLERVLRGY
jgi:hypothetical protein